MNQESFSYTYSADRQAEVAAIRSKYTAAPVREDPMVLLRKLDAGVTQKATVAGLVTGIVSTLILGTGMSLFMSDLGSILGLSMPMVPGILLGVLGIAGVIAAYPVYQLVLKAARAKAAPRILELAAVLEQAD